MNNYKSKGVIYILTNKAFSNLVKIGYADDLERRVAQLNSSDALPYPFEIYAYYTASCRLTDLKLHTLIDKLNPSLRTRSTVNGRARVREFFELSPEDAYSILEAIAEISDTKEHLVKYSAQSSVEPVSKRIIAQTISTSTEIIGTPIEGVFKLIGNRLTAYMKIQNGKYIVLRGAELGIVKDSLQNSLRVLRQQLLIQNKIKMVEGKTILDIYIPFDSPSAAAKFVMGSSVDGWKYWINSEGISLEKFR